jgi:catechol 2,3-dioxygenase-like lactoylglutathione lyase family enzyme
MAEQLSPVEIQGIDHVVLKVSNIERALAFYTGVLGLAVECILEDLGIYQVRCGRNLIDLMVLPKGTALAEKEARGMDHLCLMVHGDYDAILAHLKAHDIPITFGPIEIYGATGFGTSIYVQDPDGHTLELKSNRPQYPVRTTLKDAIGTLTRPMPKK